MVISSRKFALLFDNSTRGYLDLGAAEKDVLEFGAVGGRMSYKLVAVRDYLFWFGPELQRSMGNLEWDRKAFPHPEGLLANLQEQGVKLILITEPFLLVKCSKYDEAVRRALLCTNARGNLIFFILALLGYSTFSTRKHAIGFGDISRLDGQRCSWLVGRFGRAGSAS